MKTMSLKFILLVLTLAFAQEALTAPMPPLPAPIIHGVSGNSESDEMSALIMYLGFIPIFALSAWFTIITFKGGYKALAACIAVICVISLLTLLLPWL